MPCLVDAVIDASQIRFSIAVLLVGLATFNYPAICGKVLQNAYSSVCRKAFTATETVRDVVIGMADGLTVPFALAGGPGRRGPLDQGDRDRWARRNRRGCDRDGSRRLSRCPDRRRTLRIRVGSRRLGNRQSPGQGSAGGDRHIPRLRFAGRRSDNGGLRADGGPQALLDFMMRFELGLDEPDPKRAPISAGMIAASYFVDGMIALTPYILTSSSSDAFAYSL